jgi:hypothetical protein
MSALGYLVYPVPCTNSSSNAAANHPEHRRSQCVDAADQLASRVLLGIAVAGSSVACLLTRLVIGQEQPRAHRLGPVADRRRVRRLIGRPQELNCRRADRGLLRAAHPRPSGRLGR